MKDLFGLLDNSLREGVHDNEKINITQEICIFLSFRF